MKKPVSLREVLVAALDAKHHLSANPDRLLMVATNWRPQASARPGRSLQIAYTLEMTLLDFTGDPFEITIPLMLWLERHQHDILLSPETAGRGVNATFEMLDHSKYDVHMSLNLTERVRFVPRDGGGHDIEYLDEPEPLAFETGEPLHAVYLNGDLLMHCEAHPDLGL